MTPDFRELNHEVPIRLPGALRRPHPRRLRRPGIAGLDVLRESKIASLTPHRSVSCMRGRSAVRTSAAAPIAAGIRDSSPPRGSATWNDDIEQPPGDRSRDVGA